MEIVERNDESVVIRVSRVEASILNNALNEILHGPESIEEWEFQTRVGVSRDEAEKLLRALHDAAS